MSERFLELFFEAHHGLPRQGPGSRESTRRALAMVPDLPECPRILDLGCGPGRQSLDLAELTGGTVTAVDIHEPFLDQLRAEAQVRGLAGRVAILNRDMAQTGLPPACFDLLWSEGALYTIGLGNALCAIRPLLRPGGCLAFTELAWLSDERPQEAARFWAEGYPEMLDIPGNLALLESAGYEPLGHFILPAEDWWREYYAPLEANLPAFERKHAGEAEAMQVAALERAEMDLHRGFHETYGYVFHVARRKG